MNGRQPRRMSNCFKDKEEELSFFRDLQKREKDRVHSLLQPVSDEFEPCGTYGMYGMESGGRKGTEVGFLAESGKNDYNWLKTPPATPLFPSLEMETNGQELIIQREIPIIKPLSRFAGNQESSKTKIVTNTSTTLNPKPKLIQRHKTPNGRPTISSLIDKKNMKTSPVMTNQPNNLATNLSKTRGVSPFVRPNTPGFSDEMPPNLRMTIRPASATRGRPTNQNPSTPQKQDMNSKIRRQSCSPSVTRGRKVETDGNAAKQTTGNRAQVLGSRMVDRFMNARISNVEERREKMRVNGSILNQNSRIISSAEDRQAKIKLNDSSMNEGSGFGRLMSKSSLDKAIISSAEDRQAKIKLNGSSMNEGSGFGRLMSKSSLDMATKHMELQRDSSNARKHGMVPARKS